MRRPSELSARLLGAYDAHDWATLESLYHRDALLVTDAGERRPLTGPQTVAALRQALADPVYAVSVEAIHDLDAEVALIEGRVRHRLRHGGFADRGRSWLHVWRGGSVWRGGTYPSTAHAREALRRNGPGLGIAAPPGPEPDASGVVVGALSRRLQS